MFKKLIWQKLKNYIKEPFYLFYQSRLNRKAKLWKLPQHIGIIMDGNRRFARSSGLSKIIDGHERGANKLREVLNWCLDLKIPVMTVWSFSMDNFERSYDEVEEILELIERKTNEVREDPDVHKHKIRVRYIGLIEMLPASLQKAIRHTEEVTAKYNQYVLNIAVAYGGREEITGAFKAYFKDQINKGISPQSIVEGLDANQIDGYLYTSGLPEPDLIIRTSGEVRMSGFLMWQSLYSEYYFCDSVWPAFRKIDFLRALRSYDERQRRYGK